MYPFEDKLPLELRFGRGDIVKIAQLTSKTQWNGKLATIAGAFSQAKGRWPIQMNFDTKLKALLQTKNLRVYKPKARDLRKSQTYLVSGYVKRHFTFKYKHKLLPSFNDINRILYKFLGNSLLSFDRCHTAFTYIIQQNGKLVWYDVDRIPETYVDKVLGEMGIHIGCSLGVCDGITNFAVKCQQCSPGVIDKIGITSNVSECAKGQSHLKMDGYIYSIDNFMGVTKLNTSTNREWINIETESVYSKQFSKFQAIAEGRMYWRNNDIVTICVDCEAWTVTFYCNEQKINTQPIEHNLRYHLFISFVSPFAPIGKYEILS